MKKNREKKREVVVITGASAGVGRAAARHFGRHGAAVALVARGRTGLLAAQREVEDAGGEAIVIPTDVADPDAVERAAAITERAFGPIDIWVNNAMTTIFAQVWDVKPEEFRRATEVTYLGFVYGTLAALKRMRPRDHGVIIQVGSALTHRSIPLQSAYCGAKHAILGFTDSLRSELIREKSSINLTVVQLPALNTPQFSWVRNRLPKKPQPVPPIFQPEVAAEAIYFAAHHPRRELMVGWPTIKAIMGQKFIPGLLDHYLADAAYDGQQTDQPEEKGRPDNLWSPLDEDFGAHGDFDEEAAANSPMLWVVEHRKSLALAAGLLTTFAAGLHLIRIKTGRSTRGRCAYSSEFPDHPRLQREVTRVR